MSIRDIVADWIARHLPRDVVYWAAIRVWAHGTTGRWSDTEVTDLTMDAAISRWNEPNISPSKETPRE